MSRIAGSHQKLGEAGWVLALNMEAAQFCWYLVFGFLAFRTVREYISVTLSTQLINCYSSSRKVLQCAPLSHLSSHPISQHRWLWLLQCWALTRRYILVQEQFQFLSRCMDIICILRTCKWPLRKHIPMKAYIHFKE
jgi:hypothetical protein